MIVFLKNIADLAEILNSISRSNLQKILLIL